MYGPAINGSSGAANALVGVCVDTNTAFDGGYAEVGTPGYVVIDGSEQNPAGQGQGYAGLNVLGVSDTSKDNNCDGADNASPSHNSGGCFWLKPAPASVNALLQNPVTAMFICGNTSGPDWRASGAPADGATRDGCSIP